MQAKVSDLLETLPVTDQGQPGRSFKEICACLLPVIDLDVSWRIHAVN